jgi:tetratricopeptide (TPR) repeat protein
VAEGLQDRRPEVEALRSLGQVALQVGAYAVGARYFQRAFALAEAELDTLGAIAASEGLGDAALRQEQLSGAHSWYSRGLRLAEASGDQVRWGRFERQLGVLAQRQGDLASASDHLSRSRVRLEPSGEAHEMARTLAAQGALEVELGNYQAASAAYREALAWVQREPKDAELEMDIRTRIGELLLEAGRLLEAEEELRRAEEVAIAANLTVRLIHLYTLMGQLRGRQADETGFVFFEQAIDLCRMVGPSPTAEAHVYFEYGRFRQRLEQLDEARAYFERARGMFERAGESAQQDRAAKALGQLSA